MATKKTSAKTRGKRKGIALVSTPEPVKRVSVCIPYRVCETSADLARLAAYERFWDRLLVGVCQDIALAHAA